MGKIRRQHSGKIKLEAAVATISGNSPVSELSQKYGVQRPCLRAHKTKLYHLGIRGGIARSTLADANELRDWHLQRLCDASHQNCP